MERQPIRLGFPTAPVTVQIAANLPPLTRCLLQTLCRQLPTDESRVFQLRCKASICYGAFYEQGYDSPRYFVLFTSFCMPALAHDSLMANPHMHLQPWPPPAPRCRRTTARPHWWMPCCASPRSSAPAHMWKNASWTPMLLSVSAASPFCPRTLPYDAR